MSNCQIAHTRLAYDEADEALSKLLIHSLAKMWVAVRRRKAEGYKKGVRDVLPSCMYTNLPHAPRVISSLGAMSRVLYFQVYPLFIGTPAT